MLRLNTQSQFPSTRLTRRDCPFDNPFQVSPARTSCSTLVAQGIQQ
jgi:hypothetical protein